MTETWHDQLSTDGLICDRFSLSYWLLFTPDRLTTHVARCEHHDRAEAETASAPVLRTTSACLRCRGATRAAGGTHVRHRRNKLNRSDVCRAPRPRCNMRPALGHFYAAALQPCTREQSTLESANQRTKHAGGSRRATRRTADLIWHRAARRRGRTSGGWSRSAVGRLSHVFDRPTD
jgi:hypothetical protein